MPKIKDAFALRDFDEARIWKQKFFRFDEGKGIFQSRFIDLPSSDDSEMYDEFRYLWERPHEITDEEILDTYCSQAMKSQKEYNYARVQEIIDILKEIEIDVSAYFEKLCRHSKRLEEYLRKWNELICSDETFSATEIRTRTRRIQSLLKSYSDVQSAIKKLQRAIKRHIVEIMDAYEKSDRNVFANRLRQARMAAGYTQARMAKKIGLTTSAYTNYEICLREPSLSTLKKISRILKRPSDWLLGLS